MMKSAMKTVGAFYDAFGRKDSKALRDLLTEDFTFKGPLMAFGDPESYVAAMAQLPFKADIESSRFIVDDGRVAHVFTFRMTAPAAATIPMCEVITLAGDKIRSSELFYDSKLFPMPKAPS
ncbi:MAG: nuclear transport factor 2 family protein [Pseudomonadota bacterium]